ncbi:hypothetical protein QJS04_geneDACA004247 [Acorus gramineus]|uniref:Centromere protein X n=1 Tax=Acorus gramineus TaxID=55184 RepID=A0AAV9B458_ACOGR|nr:hypothetical protein QJS04_geneDACA004250 [Acorus gramineus]KAK1271134.1 hypothetical protein QJS04_geneDACA004247 [Acorus gramineus]
MEDAFDPDLIDAIFKLVWKRKKKGPPSAAFVGSEKIGGTDVVDAEDEVGTSKKNRPTTEAVQRAAIIAEAEGISKIEATHLERILPQLLLDF